MAPPGVFRRLKDWAHVEVPTAAAWCPRNTRVGHAVPVTLEQILHNCSLNDQEHLANWVSFYPDMPLASIQPCLGEAYFIRAQGRL